jgi:NAD(P)-dependent dehydrogenase (short-subunit alcohol dehydrogenase family)
MVTNQKVAIVTGSSGGIGSETALTLVRNGFTTYASEIASDTQLETNFRIVANKLLIPVNTKITWW